MGRLSGSCRILFMILSLHFHAGPSVGGDRAWSRAPPSPSQASRHRRALALRAGPCECPQAHHQGEFPISLGFLTTHKMRSHFSNVFVRPQMMFPPSSQSSFCVLCQNNHLPKMMARLRNIPALTLGNIKKER